MQWTFDTGWVFLHKDTTITQPFNRSPCFLCCSLLIFIRQYQPSINQFVYCAATVIWAIKQASSRVSVLQLSCKNVPAASVDSAENLIDCEFCVLGGMTAHRHFKVWHPGVACRPRLQSAFLRRMWKVTDRQVTCLNWRWMSEGLESLSDFIGADFKPLSLVTLLWWGKRANILKSKSVNNCIIWGYSLIVEAKSLRWLCSSKTIEIFISGSLSPSFLTLLVFLECLLAKWICVSSVDAHLS